MKAKQTRTNFNQVLSEKTPWLQGTRHTSPPGREEPFIGGYRRWQVENSDTVSRVYAQY